MDLPPLIPTYLYLKMDGLRLTAKTATSLATLLRQGRKALTNMPGDSDTPWVVVVQLQIKEYGNIIKATMNRSQVSSILMARI
jgi:hypothetical protein